MDCLFCNSSLTQKILDLGHSPLANALLNESDFRLPETNYPLQLFVCNHCWLVQLHNRPDPTGIFNEHYAYISSTSITWQKHCEQFALEMVAKIDEKDGLVVEVGCNDGTLLKHFKQAGLKVLGIDPASMATQLASQLDIPIINNFFNKDLAETLRKKNQTADLLVGNNVLAHVPDINHFVAGISILLKPNGIATLEVPYLPNLFANAEFDTVYHEHYFYFSITALHHIFNKHQLEIFDLKPLDIHGGSIRVYLQLKNTGNHKPKPIVFDYFQKEKELGITTPQWYNGLQSKSEAIKIQFLNWLSTQLLNNKKIVAYGAAAKGNTFLNYCGVTKAMIPFVADATVQKQGKFLPGSHIPIVAEAMLEQFKPDYILVLPWNFKEEINNRLNYVKGWGAQLVYFIPQFQLV